MYQTEYLRERESLDRDGENQSLCSKTPSGHEGGTSWRN